MVDGEETEEILCFLPLPLAVEVVEAVTVMVELQSMETLAVRVEAVRMLLAYQVAMEHMEQEIPPQHLHRKETMGVWVLPVGMAAEAEGLV